MSYLRLPYDEAATATEMTSDCRAVEAALHLPQRPPQDYPHEAPQGELTVSPAAARLAAAYTED